MRMRRILLTTTATMTIGVLGAGPALAHYCYKANQNEVVVEKSRSQAWIPIQDFVAMIADEIPPLCPEGQLVWDSTISDLTAQNVRVKGPGVLAGGTQGTGRTPDHMGYLLDVFDEVLDACGMEPPDDEH